MLCVVYALVPKLVRVGSSRQAHFVKPKPKGGKGGSASPSPPLGRALAKGAMVSCSMASTATGAPTIVRDLCSRCLGIAGYGCYRAARRWRRSRAAANSRMPPPSTSTNRLVKIEGGLADCSTTTTATGVHSVVRDLHTRCSGEAGCNRHRIARRWRRSRALANSRMPSPSTSTDRLVKIEGGLAD